MAITVLPADWRNPALPAGFDWKNPDYSLVYRQRMETIVRIQKAKPIELEQINAYYREHEWDFINDWGMTYDPRMLEIGKEPNMPFLLFKRQIEYVMWIKDRWLSRRPGLVEKTRDCGASWLAMAFSCTSCKFRAGMKIGFTSRDEDAVDKTGDPDSLLFKGRFFMSNLPPIFRGDWDEVRDAPYMRIRFPETGSYISGESGSEVGRGGRNALYFSDEDAHNKNAETLEKSISMNTNCRIDISSVRGMNNPFARKRHRGKVEVFIFDWRDDPRKDEKWYEDQKEKLEEETIAQEIDRDYGASIKGIVIPMPWIRSAVGALKKLGIAQTGSRGMSLDIADEGPDKNASCKRWGVQVEECKDFSGKGSDTYATVQMAMTEAEEFGAERLRYDGDGLGALVRGDARAINEIRKSQGRKVIPVEAFRGSGAVFDPEGKAPHTDRLNKDYYKNCKAQSWMGLRERFRKTHRWVTLGTACNPDDIISINENIEDLEGLIHELVQPVKDEDTLGKLYIEKTPDGMKSPNRGDALMMEFSKIAKGPMMIDQSVLNALRARGAR